MRKTKHNHKQPTIKERGGWLSAWLILIIAHSIFAAFLILHLRAQQNIPSSPWFWLLLLALAVADIVAAIAIWNWKRWGFVLYAISTVVSIVVGLVLTGSQLIVFHDIIPLAILGYLLKDKQQYLDRDYADTGNT